MILKIKLNLPNFIDESRRLNELEISNHASLCSQRLYLRLDRLPAEVRHVAVVVTVLVLGHILLQGRNGNLLRQLKRNILEKQLFVKFKDERLFSFRVFSRAFLWIHVGSVRLKSKLPDSSKSIIQHHHHHPHQQLQLIYHQFHYQLHFHNLLLISQLDLEACQLVFKHPEF